MRVRILLTMIAVLLAGAAAAQEVATIAVVHGEAQVGRAGSWTAAAVGMGVQVGDELRTGDGQLRVVFQDDSVIDLSEDSLLVVDEQQFAPEESYFSSALRLLGGQVRAMVGKYYSASGASYEIETPTAVAGVRGTSFIVGYDPDTDTTQVIGIRGRIAVRSLEERIGETVYVTAQESTTVSRGEAPTRPRSIDERRLFDEVEGLELLSLGKSMGVAGAGVVAASEGVPAPDRAPSSSSLVGQVGRDDLRNSADVAGQPLSVVGAERGSLGF